MSKFRVEYLPKLGADVKMVHVGFDSIESAEIFALANLKTAPYASITLGERRVKDLWRKVECEACVNRWRDGTLRLSDVPVFSSPPDLSEYFIKEHGVTPAREAMEAAQRRFDERPLLDFSKKYAHEFQVKHGKS